MKKTTFTLLAAIMATAITAQTLADSLAGQTFMCYRVEWSTDSTTHHFTNVSLFLNLLGQYGATGPSAYDLTGEPGVQADDMLVALGSYQAPQPIPIPNWEDFTPFDNFGEGNTWMTYTGPDPTIAFGWLHRTPFDEAGDGNSLSYQIKTFEFDVVTNTGVWVYFFARI